MVLSWPGLRLLHQILKECPLPQGELVSQMAERAGIQPDTARRYIVGARALGLVGQHGDRWVLAPASTIEDLLRHSTLIRLFQYWGHADTLPKDISLYRDVFRSLGEERMNLLKTAKRLSKVASLEQPDRSRALLLLTAGQLRAEHLGDPRTTWDALEALKVYSGLLQGKNSSESLQESFLSDCRYLHHRQLSRMDVVQYLTGTNRRYAALSTPLGFLRGLWFNEVALGKPIPKVWKDPSLFRRVAG